MGKKKILLTVPQYATHRGVDQGAVRYAIREGKLSSSIVRDGSGSVMIDQDSADLEWVPRVNAREQVVTVQKKTSKTKSKSTQKNKSKAKKQKKKTEWDPDEPWDTSMLIPVGISKMRMAAHEAELARIKVEKELGLLVIAKEVEEMWVKVGTITRSKVMGIPSKAKQRIPEFTDSQYLILEMIVREALEEISSDPVGSEEDHGKISQKPKATKET